MTKKKFFSTPAPGRRAVSPLPSYLGLSFFLERVADRSAHLSVPHPSPRCHYPLQYNVTSDENREFAIFFCEFLLWCGGASSGTNSTHIPLEAPILGLRPPTKIVSIRHRGAKLQCAERDIPSEKV